MDDYLKPNIGTLVFIAAFVGGIVFALLLLSGVGAYFWPA